MYQVFRYLPTLTGSPLKMESVSGATHDSRIVERIATHLNRMAGHTVSDDGSFSRVEGINFYMIEEV
jgi:hypothetical protein